MRGQLLLLLSIVIHGVLGCCATANGREVNDAGTQAAERELEKMRAAYGALAEYEDSGDATFVGADGTADSVSFSTRFSRANGVRFDFKIPSIARPNEYRVGHLIAKDGKSAEVFVEGDAQATTRSLTAGTGELQGITYLSSILVPRLLHNELFCTCTRASELVVEGSNTLDGRECIRLRFISPARNTFLLWIDRQNALLRRVEVELSQVDGAPARSIVRFRIAHSR